MTELWEYLKSHAARVLGVVFGALIPVLWWKIGFFRTLLLVLGALIGYLIGRAIDDREWFRGLLEKILPRKEE